MTSVDATSKPSLYEMIGGEEGVRRFTRRFYQVMDSAPEAAACRAIHPETLTESEQKLFEFLSGWLGGPQLFVERRGAPMLRARHLQTPIGEEETRGWILCFRWALVDTVADPEVRAAILPQIEMLAQHMRNRV
jgi:hemoglobin